MSSFRVRGVPMRKCLSILTTVGFAAALFVAPAASADAATAVPTCSPTELTVAAGKWLFSTTYHGSDAQWLPIAITNEGGTCVIGGLPKIVPTGASWLKPSGEALVGAIVERAAIHLTTYKMLTLTHGKAAYTYLKLEFPTGSSATAKKWTATCKPATATGFTINIVPAKHLLNRHVKATLPDVCTTGKANDLTTVPLGATPLR